MALGFLEDTTFLYKQPMPASLPPSRCHLWFPKFVDLVARIILSGCPLVVQWMTQVGDKIIGDKPWPGFITRPHDRARSGAVPVHGVVFSAPRPSLANPSLSPGQSPLPVPSVQPGNQPQLQARATGHGRPRFRSERVEKGGG